MNRRQFLDRLAELVGSTASAAALVPLLQNDYARAAIVALDDPRLAVERVSYDSPKGKISGYLVRPKDKSKRPAVLVIHENRGLNPHIEDVARRYAAEGFLALAPDLLSVNGGTPAEEDKARELHTKTEREDMIAAAVAGAAYLAKHGESTGKVGTVGFCFGGGVVNRLATDSPDIAAAAPYYGIQPPAEKVANIRRRCCCTMPRWTRTSTRASRPSKRRSRPATSATASIFIPAPSTPSTTTPAPRATTRPPPSLPGAPPSRYSRRICARRRGCVSA